MPIILGNDRQIVAMKYLLGRIGTNFVTRCVMGESVTSLCAMCGLNRGCSNDTVDWNFSEAVKKRHGT